MTIIDTGTATKSKDGSKGTVGILESIKLQGTEKFKLKLEISLVIKLISPEKMIYAR